jgi:hypothetical protein
MLLVFSSYIIFSFVQWKFNPYEWGIDVRAGYCILTGFILFIKALFSEDLPNI